MKATNEMRIIMFFIQSKENNSFPKLILNIFQRHLLVQAIMYYAQTNSRISILTQTFATRLAMSPTFHGEMQIVPASDTTQD